MTAWSFQTFGPPPGTTEIAGILIPSTSPLFLGLVGAHVLVALVPVFTGAAVMIARKGTGRHHRLGTVYFWSLAATVALALLLSALRWRENYPLAVLGLFALAAATIGRAARRYRWRAWAPLHISGMGFSYVFMLTAFYVDNGKNLPLWRELPSTAYWLIPALVGSPIILWAIRRHAPPGSGSKRMA